MKSYAIANVSEGYRKDDFLGRIAALSRLKVDIIQLRARQLDDRDLLDLAILCRDRIGDEVAYLINGRADIAMAVEADGVHLPSDGVPVDVVRSMSSRLKIGVSCHTVEQVERAAETEADLVVLGPLFDSRSTTKSASVSIEDLKQATVAGIDVYALGGLSIDKLPLLEGTGVRGVAAITMFMQDEPIERIISAIDEATS